MIYSPDTRFVPGGFHVLSTGDDLAIVTAGYMVHAAREAVTLLAEQNIRATLVDAYSLPCDADALVEVLQRAGRRTLVVEDNYGGGLASEVAEIAARVGGLRVESLICQRIPKSTRTTDSILEYCGLSPAQVADHALALRQRP